MRRRDDLRQAAIKLRRAGATYPEIAAALGVSKGSISLWVRGVPHQPRLPLSDDPRRVGLDRYFASRRKARVTKQEEDKCAAANEIGELTDRELLIAGAVAYWAEGAKSKPWRPSEALRFMNSDATMVQLFLRWLELNGVEPSRIRFQVHIHESADIEKAQAFWAACVNQPVDRLQPPTLKRHKPLTNRKNVGTDYHGCLSVWVTGPSDLYRRAEGIWWAVAASATSTPIDR
jgi:hypothetical protein